MNTTVPDFEGQMPTEIPPTLAGRTEIDTSAPFESVKEAANRFGGMAFWKPTSHNPSSQLAPEDDEDQVVDILQLEEQASQFERDLVTKERETLDVLKELESTKDTVEQLKSKLKKEVSALEENRNVNSDSDGNDSFSFCPSLDPGLILLELKKAKMNLTRTTSELANIRAAVDLYSKKIEHERVSLEKTRKKLTLNTSKVSSLEGELGQTRQKYAEVHDSSDIAASQLNSETEQFKKTEQAVKLQVQRSEIEQTRARIKMAEIRLIAAKKMKEAARASERVALAEIRSMSKGCNGPHQESNENVTITMEEYSSLVSERACEVKVDETMVGVEEANVSRVEILKSVEEALEEVKISKRVLEEALGRVEVANKDKLAVEEALRAWKSVHGRKRRSSVHIQNQTKFKSSHSSSAQMKESILVDVSGDVEPVLKATLSIGEILSRKLMLTEEYESGAGKRKVSLRQMLGKPSGCDVFKKSGKENREVVVPGKKFGLGQISVLVAKQSKKKKNQDSN